MDTMKQRLRLLGYVAVRSCQYPWWVLKEFIKRLIGRKPYRDERLIFFRRYLLHVIGLRRIRAITCVTDDITTGPGGLAFFIMSTISFARACGLEYRHTPFGVLAGSNGSMQQWASTWETVFNLGAGELSCNAEDRDVINRDYYVRDYDLCFGWRDRGEQLIECFQSLFPDFRRKYDLNKSPSASAEVVVAVNIRRGEVSARDYTEMYTSADKIARIARAVKAVLDGAGVPFQLHVYGQGEEAEFADLASLGARFFLNADPVWTMQKLIEADVLVVAKSNFSYYAGVISTGIKLFEPCSIQRAEGEFPGLPPAWSWAFFAELDDWFPCQEDGSFDRETFERQFSLRMRRRNELQSRVEPFEP